MIEDYPHCREDVAVYGLTMMTMMVVVVVVMVMMIMMMLAIVWANRLAVVLLLVPLKYTLCRAGRRWGQYASPRVPRSVGEIHIRRNLIGER